MKAIIVGTVFLLLIFSSSCFASRTKFATERLELGAYTVWGITEADDCPRQATVVDPDGFIYLVEIGQIIGKRNGRIVRIDDSGIDVIELVPDGKQGWKEVSVRMELPEWRKMKPARN
jgi:type IV pilus assembly protein PilP